MEAYIYLENDIFLSARAFSCGGTFLGELVFNTSMSGHQEIISDPSYAGQFIVFSMPEIGMVGTNEDDDEGKDTFASGIFVREFSSTFSNYRVKESLDTYLKEHQKIGTYDIDTCLLVKLIRDSGNLGAIVSTEIPNKKEFKEKLLTSRKIDEVNFVKEVSTKKPYKRRQGVRNGKTYNELKKAEKKIAVIDYGVKRNILNELVDANLAVEVFLYNVKAQELITLFEKGEIHGAFLSNGPGEPEILKDEVAETKKLAGAKVPMLGICLGYQLLSNAFGYGTYKTKFGQRGADHPVTNLENKKVEIIVQNHNYSAPEELCEVAFIAHRNSFGDNVEGVRYKDYPVISVQHHPESSSGPHEGKYIFKGFANLL